MNKQYWMNTDTGRVTERDFDDPPYGNLWIEISQEQYNQFINPLTQPTGDHDSPALAPGASVPSKSPPTHIEGRLVHHLPNEIMFNGERWITLIPDDEDDHRIWEFSLDTGRIIQTTH